MEELSVSTILQYVGLGVGGLVTFLLLLGCFFTVAQQRAAIVTRFGKFKRIASAGLNLKLPLIERIAGLLNLRVMQLDVKVETKTLDDVFVMAVISVQYYVLETNIYEAFYKLQNVERQITSYVFDVVRAEVPKLKLDDVFAKKDDIANAVKKEIAEAMRGFGYGITKVLVTEIDPDEKVKAAMNEINAATRLRVAASEKGEAEKILKIKAAEAEAESKKLQGIGIANQRKAIVDGLRDSVRELGEAMQVDPKEVMLMIQTTQYFDTMQAMAASSHSKVIFVPSSGGGLQEVVAGMRNAMLAATQVTAEHSEASSGNGKIAGKSS